MADNTPTPPPADEPQNAAPERKYKKEHEKQLLDCAKIAKEQTPAAGIEKWNEWFEQKALQGVWLEGADLRMFEFPTPPDTKDDDRLKLWLANLQGAQLHSANLQGANLVMAKLKGAELHEANLEGADLQYATGIVFDNTKIRNARFSPRPDCLWMTLRRKYTGMWMIVNFLFLVAFIAPYAAKAVFWSGVSHAETAAVDGLHGFEAYVRKHPEPKADNPRQAKWVETWNTHKNDRIATTTQKVTDAVNRRTETYPIWQVLIGFHKGWSYWLTAILLIIYNICRAILTFSVNPMRDEEERSGYTPYLHRNGSGLTNSYGWLRWPHCIGCKLSVLAIASFVYHAYSILTGTVTIMK